MIELPFIKKKEDNFEDVKEDVFVDKAPKRLLQKIHSFEQKFLEKKDSESIERKENLRKSVELRDSPILRELEEQHSKGLISSKSYEEVLNAFKSLKTLKAPKESMGEETKEIELSNTESEKKKEDTEDSKSDEKNVKKQDESVKEDTKPSEPEKEKKSDEEKDEKKDSEQKEEKPKKKSDVDEDYTGLGPLNALRKLLKNVYAKNQKEKAYWSRAGNFFFPLDTTLSEINSILSQNGLMSIELDVLKKYLDTLGFIDGTSIVDMPVKTPDMEKEESRTIMEFTPQALEKINSEDELEEPDQKGKKTTAEPAVATQAIPQATTPAQPATPLPSAPVSAPAPTVESVSSMPSDKMIEYEKAFEELRTKILSAEERFKGLNEKLDGFSERLSEVKGQVTTREKSFGEMQLKIETLNANVAEINPQTIAKFERETTNRLSGIDNSFKTLEGTVTDLLKKFDKISEVFEDLRNLKLLIDVGKDVGEKLIKIEDAEKIIQRLANKVEDMYLQVERKFSDLPVFVDKVNRIDGLSFELLQAMDNLKTRMADYTSKTELAEFKAKMDNKFSRVEDEIDMVSDKELTGSDRDYFAEVLDLINEKEELLKHDLRILNEQYDDALISEKAYNELRRIKDEKKRSFEELEGKIISVLDRGRTDRRDLEMLYRQCNDFTGKKVRKPVKTGEEPKPEEKTGENAPAEVKPAETLTEQVIPAPSAAPPTPVEAPKPIETPAENPKTEKTHVQTPSEPQKPEEKTEEKSSEPSEPADKPSEPPKNEENLTENKPEETKSSDKSAEKTEESSEPVKKQISEEKAEKPIEELEKEVKQEEKSIPEPVQKEIEDVQKDEVKKEEKVESVEKKTEANLGPPGKVVKYVTFSKNEPDKLTKPEIKKNVEYESHVTGDVKDILVNLHRLRQEYEPGNYSLASFDDAKQKLIKKP
ncbi:MAG: hypothetical protein GON13_02770 [Nanoarchaeota archaeon]|nr:hypothetical protein [Nanoarchaeota archaeon]